MKTFAQAKSVMISAFTVLKAQNETVLKHSFSHKTYSRMIKLFDLFRGMCFEVAKYDETLAKVYYEVAERMLTEAFEALDMDAFEALEDEGYSTDPMDGTHTFTAMDEALLEDWYEDNRSFKEQTKTEHFVDKSPIIWKFNGKVLNSTDLDDLPF